MGCHISEGKGCWKDTHCGQQGTGRTQQLLHSSLRGGIKSITDTGGINSRLAHLLHWLPWKPVQGNIPFLAPQPKYFYEAEFFSLLIYQQTAILKWPENEQGIRRREGITSYTYSCVISHSVCPTVCDPMDYIPPGSSVHGILKARILK